MPKFFRSRFFIIALLCAIVLVIVPSVLSSMGLGDQVRSAVGTLATPFRYAFTEVAEAAAYYSGLREGSNVAVDYTEAEELDETDRGAGGFGSTGR